MLGLWKDSEAQKVLRLRCYSTISPRCRKTLRVSMKSSCLWRRLQSVLEQRLRMPHKLLSKLKRLQRAREYRLKPPLRNHNLSRVALTNSASLMGIDSSMKT